METYHGHVRTPADAIILFEACRLGLLPRVQRRLSEKERQAIKSGSVFVWDEREAGMRRWTDGKSWSASRVSGSFLTYREMEGKRGGAHVQSSKGGKTPESNRGSDEDGGDGGEEGPDGYRYKPDGLMKQSFSITTSTGQHLHLISYYARSHPTAAGLNQPSTDPALRNIRPQKGLYPESSVNDQQNLPVVTRGPMGGSAFSMSPHALGAYNRSGATHPHSYAPSPYAWAPAPITSATHIPVIPYVPSYLPPLSGPPGIHYSQHPHMPPTAVPLPSPYDRPAHPGENTLPVPLPPGAAPVLQYYSSTRSPHLSQPVMLEPPRRGSPGQPLGSPSNQADPRLVAPRPESNRPETNGHQANHVPSPPPLKGIPVNQNGSPLSKVEPSSSATMVPSINSLMNVASRSATNGATSSLADSPKGIENQTIVTGNRSPNGARPTPDGPKDIPSEKIGFREDVRALRQLDRVFSA
ncbi:hypothetical protein AJ80_04391 [Polytolypa hystricis UAMH7299]|uniref:cAMP-independent regulatory protein pac2 n=1 Tax=Polytolypa hystricis (strain UAMH7299) TaxID=1447883 RepID=A0A2B7Y3H0_POLH7|nr:hypothetical protein AJ80_04391 [Polytolypa hystricis UAMH7299]